MACSDPVAPGVGGTSGTGSTGTGTGDDPLIPDIKVPEVTTTTGTGDEVDSEEQVNTDEPGAPGSKCTFHGDCKADWCVETPTGKKCSELCVDQCTVTGWGCKKAQTLGEEVLICLPLFPHLCEPCNTDEECSAGLGDIGDKCIARDDGQGSFCGGDCSTGVACPDNYECAEVDFGAGGGIKKQCVPVDGVGECTCSDAAIARAASTSCTTSNDFGTCAGERVCGTDGLTDCLADVPVAEACNGEDDNCNGEVDEADATGCITYYKDFDSDGFGVNLDSQCLCVPDIVYKAVEPGDCNDGKAQIGPGQPELCNEIDDNCNKLIDEEDALGCKDYFADKDEDGWGNADAVKCLCVPDKVNNVQKPGDCDDNDELAFPAALEACGGKDTNCDGKVAPQGSPGCISFYKDSDNDGFGAPNDQKCLCAADPPYTALKNTDCNDLVSAIAPDADEFCDTIDNDCDGAIDEGGAVDCIVYYKDADQDTFGKPGDTQCLCGPTGGYTSLAPTDCNDLLGSVNPGGAEVCNGVDDDCDGETDEPEAGGCVVYYEDADEDGYGIENSICLCAPEAPFVALEPGDCNDQLDEQNPDIAELCNDGGVDNDCDGLTDEADSVGCGTLFLDEDEDGFGSDDSQCLCGPTDSYTAALAGDCADTNELVGPGATEACDGADNDCDGAIDEEDALNCEVYYEDADKDGYGALASSKCLCGPATPFLASAPQDCNDANADVNPDGVEVCGDGLDNDCNGSANEAGSQGCITFYMDTDGDGFGLPGSGSCICTPSGQHTATNSADCDDGELLVFPGTECAPGTCSGFLVTSPSVCTGAGVCEGGSTGPCPGGYQCDDTTCLTSCGSDLQCQDGYYCDGVNCQLLKVDGAQCGAGNECGSEHCSGGFCCDAGECCQINAHCDDGNVCTYDACADFQCTHTNTSAQCAPKSCSGGALTQAKSCDADGACTAGGAVGPCPGNYACASNVACGGNCTLDSHCQTDFYCQTGDCVPKKSNGVSCTGQNQCQSGYCANGVCCGSGGCCTENTDCVDFNPCTTGTCQNNQCVYAANDALCAQGSCQGLIYNLPKVCIGGQCPAGGATQDCSGTDPCKTYSCTAGGCAVGNAQTGTGCLTPSCVGNLLTTAKQCDADGGCNVGGVTSPCQGKYVCKDSTTCATTCTDNSGCVDGFYCQGGACLAKLPDGSTCQNATQCTSGHCNNATCCSGGKCCKNASSCGDANTCTTDSCVNFVCNNINNTVQCSAGQCSGLIYTKPKFCSAGACVNGGGTDDCTGPNACLQYQCSNINGCTATPQDSGTVCNPASCAGTVYTPPNTCNGNGNCVSSQTQQCDDGQVCNGAETCSASQGCVAGNANDVFICGDGVCNPT